MHNGGAGLPVVGGVPPDGTTEERGCR
jgi:hypothetical protein